MSTFSLPSSVEYLSYFIMLLSFPHKKVKECFEKESHLLESLKPFFIHLYFSALLPLPNVDALKSTCLCF